MKENEEKGKTSSKSGKVFLVGVIVFCVLALVYLSLKGSGDGSRKPLPNLEIPGEGDSGGQKTAAPDFTVETLDGRRVRLSDFRGRVVLISFWSSSCGACLLQLEGLERLASQMSGKPFELMAVTTDSRRTAQSVLEMTSLNIPVYLDPTRKAHGSYGIFGLPATYIVAPDGTIANHVVGAADWGHHSVIEYLDKLIGKNSELSSEASGGQSPD